MADHLTFSSSERKILESCAAAMDGLALYLGEGYEFVLHSLEDLSHSVVKIINGHYSNRKPGEIVSDGEIRDVNMVYRLADNRMYENKKTCHDARK